MSIFCPRDTPPRVSRLRIRCEFDASTTQERRSHQPSRSDQTELGSVTTHETDSRVQLPYRIVQRSRGGLVFKAHRLVYHSTLGLRVIKKEKTPGFTGNQPRRDAPALPPAPTVGPNRLIRERWEYSTPGTHQSNRWIASRKRGAGKINRKSEVD